MDSSNGPEAACRSRRQRRRINVYGTDLYPFSRTLELKRISSSGIQEWTIDLMPQQEGDFQPVTCDIGPQGQLFFAGRIDGAVGGIVYRMHLNWDGVNPNPSYEVVYAGDAIGGDISAIHYLGEYNNTVALFDFTNAQVSSIALTDDAAVTVIADSGTYSWLLDQFAMRAQPRLNGAGAPVGISYGLQSAREYDLLWDEHGVRSWVLATTIDGQIELAFERR